MTKKERIARIELFIDENDLDFRVGSRNTSSVVLCGYALACGTKIVKEIVDIIEEYMFFDTEVEEEIKRVFKYAKDNNYGAWWTSTSAEQDYIFEEFD